MPAVATERSSSSDERFPSTRWSVLYGVEAGHPAAIEALATRYRTAIYAWFRAEGRSPSDAADLTQEFFLRYVLDPERRGTLIPRAAALHVRYRSYLKACLRNFVRNDHRFAKARKRGGGRQAMPLEADAVAERVAASPDEAPDRALDREWARALVRQVLARLGTELDARARAVLRAAVAGEATRDTAGRLGVSEAALAQIRHRARARARKILCEEAGRTVESARDLRAELCDLVASIDEPGWLRGEA